MGFSRHGRHGVLEHAIRVCGLRPDAGGTRRTESSASSGDLACHGALDPFYPPAHDMARPAMGRLVTGLRISVCIATHEREELLAATLEEVGRQTHPPAEIVVSDSSASEAVRLAVEGFSSRRPDLRVRRVRSDRKSLPWQRWWAFSHSAGDIVLFLDDDVLLHPQALRILCEAYERLLAEGRPVAGIGFVMSWVGGGRPDRNRSSRREKWLRVFNAGPGSVTAGGLTTSLAGLSGTGPQTVEVLSGGAMSYRREVLEKVGCLKNLVSLYEAGAGRGEDAVLSSYARKIGGPLYALPDELAYHPREGRGATPYPSGGWRMGIAHTWGRAHTMRWIATARQEYRRDWSRLAVLELARAAGATVASPLEGDRWKRLGGACWGIGRTLIDWNRIPVEAR
jgi:glycosyltransferase involved in cell wall biosynthesis